MDEAPLEPTDAGVAANGDGWFVLNARDARWRHVAGRAARLDFEGATRFPQVGISLHVLQPGESIGLYHWESNQEDFLVLAGEGLLLVEGQERPLQQWDFVHCPPDTSHMIVGAGTGPCVVVAVGARQEHEGRAWGGYPVEEIALRHGVGVERETSDADEAYAPFAPRQPTRYRDGWLPD
jgi:uncharacterized cupin superfamily protein